jgi:hypothetical protein
MRTLRAPMRCPHCYEDVPPILHGMRAYCSVCGGELPITAAPGAVNVTGSPARVGATVAAALGWLVLLGGLMVALVLGGLVGLFSANAGLFVGGAVGGVSLLAWLALLLGGKKLRTVGDDRTRSAQERVLHALAAQRGGALTARQAARALSIPEEDADALLTTIAKRHDGQVSVEVDDGGGISYVFRDVAVHAARVRVEMPASRPMRVIDAELIDDEEPVAARAAQRRAAR